MPQMAPMNWIMLYIFFSIVFILFNFLNFYLFMIFKKSDSYNKMSYKTLNWKW